MKSLVLRQPHVLLKGPYHRHEWIQGCRAMNVIPEELGSETSSLKVGLFWEVTQFYVVYNIYI